MRIGFDFDGVLTNKFLKMLFFDIGYLHAHDLYIITYRFEDVYYPDMSTFNAECVNQKITFLGGTSKTKEQVINELDLDIFFEDDDCCIQQIKNAGCKCLILKPM